MVHTAVFTNAWWAAPAFDSARPKTLVVRTETVRRPVGSVYVSLE